MAEGKKNRNILEAGLSGASRHRFVLLCAQWNTEITAKLAEGARSVLQRYGVQKENIISAEVPGSFELPLGAQWMIEQHKPDAVICLGCVIKGETPHFEYIAHAASHGILRVGLDKNIPVVFGILTTHTLAQAKARSGGKKGHKGEEAALTALKMLALRSTFPAESR